MGRNVLNNMSMSNHRKNPVYQTVVTDLYNLGILEQEQAERLLGYEIPDFLVLPETPEIERTNTPKEEDKPVDDNPVDDNPVDDNPVDDKQRVIGFGI